MSVTYSSLAGLFWIVFIVVWIITATKANPSRWGSHRAGAKYRLLLIPFAAVVAISAKGAASLFGLHVGWTHSLVLAQVGLTLLAVGIAFAIWARFALGRNWGMPMTVRRKPELVTSGPYRLVRHPIYTGMLLAMLGSAMTVGSYWYVIVIVSGSYFIFSATQEEKTMAEFFPEAYPAYRKRSKMLIPFIF